MFHATEMSLVLLGIIVAVDGNRRDGVKRIENTFKLEKKRRSRKHTNVSQRRKRETTEMHWSQKETVWKPSQSPQDKTRRLTLKLSLPKKPKAMSRCSSSLRR